MAANEVRIPFTTDTGRVRTQIEAELANLRNLERQAFRTGEAATGRPTQSRYPAGHPSGRGGQFLPRGEEVTIQPGEIDKEIEANLKLREKEEKEAAKQVEDDKKERIQSFKRRNARRRKVEAIRIKAARASEKAAKEEEKAARDEERLFARDKRERIQGFRRRSGRRRRIERAQMMADRAEEKSAREEQMRRSRMMMGVAGVATALTMPISGFTPLTIGFASMSGVGFGIAAAAAVFVRGIYDVNKAMLEWRNGLVEMAESSNAVTEAYKFQKAQMTGVELVLGNVMAENRIGAMTVRRRAQLDNFENLQKGGAGMEKLFNVFGIAWDKLKAGFGSLSGDSVRQLGEASRDTIENMLRDRDFQSTKISGEAFYTKIATSALSRKDRELLRQIAAIEENTNELNKLTGITKLLSDRADAVGEGAAAVFFGLPGLVRKGYTTLYPTE